MNRVIAVFVIMLIAGISNDLIAQENGQGQVNIIQDNRLDELVQKHQEANETYDGMTGYRIQIFFDSGSRAKSKAAAARQKFLSHFPELEAYTIFDAPHFKVRVGNFRTRIEAERFLQEIRKYFEVAFVMKTKIEYPEV